jgi:hypothetical protein
MAKKFFLFFIFLTGFSSLSLAEEVTVTTYYPSPQGDYRQIRVSDDAYLSTQGGGVRIGSDIAPVIQRLAIKGKLIGGTDQTLGLYLDGAGSQTAGIGFASSKANLDDTSATGMNNVASIGIANFNGGFGQNIVAGDLAIGTMNGRDLHLTTRTGSAANPNPTRLIIKNGGRVGIGTTAPAQELEVIGQVQADGFILDGPNGPGSGGQIILTYPNTTGNRIWVARPTDGSPGSMLFDQNVVNAAIVFRTNTGTLEKMRVQWNGNVGIGTSAPAHKLQVQGSVGATGFVNISDMRLKQNISPLAGGYLEKIDGLHPAAFSWNKLSESLGYFKEGDHDIGLVAQEVEKVFPEAVVSGEGEYKSVDYGRMTVFLLQAVKELKAQNEALEERLTIFNDRFRAAERNSA